MSCWSFSLLRAGPWGFVCLERNWLTSLFTQGAQGPRMLLLSGSSLLLWFSAPRQRRRNGRRRRRGAWRSQWRRGSTDRRSHTQGTWKSIFITVYYIFLPFLFPESRRFFTLYVQCVVRCRDSNPRSTDCSQLCYHWATHIPAELHTFPIVNWAIPSILLQEK